MSRILIENMRDPLDCYPKMGETRADCIGLKELIKDDHLEHS